MDIFLSLTGDERFQVNVYLMEGGLFVAVLFQLRFYKITFKDVVLMMVYTPKNKLCLQIRVSVFLAVIMVHIYIYI